MLDQPRQILRRGLRHRVVQRVPAPDVGLERMIRPRDRAASHRGDRTAARSWSRRFPATEMHRRRSAPCGTSAPADGRRSRSHGWRHLDQAEKLVAAKVVRCRDARGTRLFKSSTESGFAALSEKSATNGTSCSAKQRRPPAFRTSIPSAPCLARWGTNPGLGRAAGCLDL